jgi:monofunctional biosynthetic peptidoglycan transglycosylase
MSIRRLLKSKRMWLSILAVVIVSLAAFVVYILVSLPDVSDLKTHNPETTALMKMRIKQAEDKGTEYAIKQNWVSFEHVPQLFKDTVRIAEDFGFYWHKGIDYEELKEALKQSIRERKFVRGASTITQQLAKNLYLSTEKSLIRKIKEYLISRRMEKTLTKDRIFELYLNVIELGPGVFGIQTASQHFFECSVSELTLEEMVRVTAVLPRPPWLRWRCRWLLHKLRLYEYISEEVYQETVELFAE